MWTKGDFSIHKPPLLEYWFHNNIICVAKLFSEGDKLFSYEEFLSECNLPPPEDYAKVVIIRNLDDVLLTF